MPIYTITVKPNSKTESVESQADGTLKVMVKASPVDGKANDGVIKLLAKHFDVPKSQIEIVRGHTSKTKRIKISE